MTTQETLLQEGALRRIRSAGDIPSRPERAHLRSNHDISEATGDRQVGQSGRAYGIPEPSIGQLQLSSSAPSSLAEIPSRSPSSLETGPVPPLRPLQERPPSTDQHFNQTEAIWARNVPLYVRLKMFFGIGRNASYARKSLVSLIWNMFWGFLQVVIIVTMLVLTGTKLKSPTDMKLSEWTACDRPLGVWASLWVVRVVLASSLAYWDFSRERMQHSGRADTEANINHNARSPMMTDRLVNAVPTTNGNTATHNPPLAAVRSTESPNPSYSRAYSRLTLISSLMTLSWFLTAHILEYTSISTCRHTSPHLWWLVFGILCIMYLMVLEVVLLGLVVLVIAPIIFIFWNIFLICIGRHPMQNPHMIKPEIGKLPKSVVERIPLVMYIPPPPENGRITSMQAHSYPPKTTRTTTRSTTKSAQRRFKLLRVFPHSGSKTPNDLVDRADGKESFLPDAPEPLSWEDNWEQNEYPFVALEGNRAACAICLMDFEEPKRKGEVMKQQYDGQPVVLEGKNSANNNLPPTIVEERRGDDLKLEDAGEGAQPLRLLRCGHVFHKTCLDPWLTDVSGRCPVCQRPVEIPKRKKSRRSP